MKQIIAAAFITVSLVTASFGQVEQNPIEITGDVVAFIKSDIIVSRVQHNGEKLIAKVRFPRNSKTEYIWLLNEFFGNKSNLPAKVFSSGGNWKFKVNRRVDCDSVLRPDYSELFKSVNTENNSENKVVFIPDTPPKINFIIAEESLGIQADKVLPCYAILSMKKS